MILKTDFETFLKAIRSTSAMRDDLKKGHKTLRDRLNADEDVKPSRDIATALAQN